MSRSQLAEWRDAIRDSGLDSSTKAVAWCLSTYMSGDGQCWPSQQLLSVGTSLSVKTVQRATARLELAGLLGINHGRGRTSNRYRALLPQPLFVASQSRHKDAAYGDSDDRSGDSDDRSGVTESPESIESFESTDGGGAASQATPPPSVEIDGLVNGRPPPPNNDWFDRLLRGDT